MNTPKIAMQIFSNNNVNIDATEAIFTPLDPSHGDAFGLITPATDEGAQIHRRTRMERYNASSCIHGSLPSCILENNAGDCYLLLTLSGESLSILAFFQ
jgi:hypothetical protein